MKWLGAVVATCGCRCRWQSSKAERSVGMQTLHAESGQGPRSVVCSGWGENLQALIRLQASNSRPVEVSPSGGCDRGPMA